MNDSIRDSAYFATRAETFKHFYTDGATLQEIGTVFGISAEWQS